MGRNFGYVRVSSREQNIARQTDALAALNLSGMKIFVDRQSGKDFNRPQYSRLVRRLRADDNVFILSIDRLGRNYREILEQWQIITKKIGANIIVLNMPLLDTRKKETDLTGTFVTDLVLQILSYVAETERKDIHERQREGIASAKARGVKFGRPKAHVPDNFDVIARKWKYGEISCEEAMQLANLGRTSLYRKTRELQL